MPLQATSGAASQDAFGGNGVAVVPTYIEDVFSTYLYTGDSSYPRTITTSIDLSTKGGLVWIKNRSTGGSHNFVDTARGREYALQSNTTAAQLGPASIGQDLASFNIDGFTLGNPTNWSANSSGALYTSWTFREQAKFFDVVTYTGNNATGIQNVAHNLGSVPGCIIIKCFDVAGYNWVVYHRSTGASQYTALNTTAAASAAPTFFNATAPTSTQFTVGTSGSTNGDGQNYVAYIFAHDAGGFGLTGTDNVISCGSYTGDGTSDGSKLVSLGYEPQWLLIKRSDSSTNGAWVMVDNMRGIVTSNSAASNDAVLEANTSAAENLDGICQLSATGFNPVGGYSNGSSATYIYIAIRRGPMKVPTTGTSVFTPATRTGTGTATTITSAGFPVDLVIGNSRNAVSYGSTGAFGNRLRGKQNLLYSPSTGAEDTTNVSITGFDVQNGISVGNTDAYSFNYSGGSYVNWFFRRAPSFMDVVCYTGTGSSMSITHNLGVGPELIIIKRRNSTSDWQVAAKINSTEYTVGASGNELALNSSGGGTTTYYIYATYFSSTAFQTGAFWTTPNVNGGTYVAYLFATCAGVSKVGSYTGTAATLQIDCGFTAGARFVLIKRTDSTGDWYVWDTARGIVSGNDPYLLLNSTAAEVTNTDYIDTYSAGFEISSTAPAAINANGGTYIFLAIA